MKHLLSAGLLLCLGLAHARANDDMIIVQNPHGGYNVIQAGGRPRTIPFFGAHGFAARQAAINAQVKPRYVVRTVAQDNGHGGKMLVGKKLYYRTAEDAQAAKASGQESGYLAH